MKIVIIRHADPDYPNNTLTEHGFAEAKALGKHYDYSDFDEIYCSPLNRAVYTCNEIGKDKGSYKICDWLTEFVHFVNIDGKKSLNWDFMPDFFEKQDNIYDYDRYLDTELMKSGNVKEAVENVYSELQKILTANGYIKENGYFKVTGGNTKTLLFVCHFGIMSVLLSYFLNIPYCVLSNHTCCLPTGVTELVTEERQKGIAQFRMLKFSDLSHLKNEGIEESFSGRFCETFDSDKRH